MSGTFRSRSLLPLLLALPLAFACSVVVNGTLDGLDGGNLPDVPAQCVGQADGTECDDGDFCNGADTCISSVCVPTGGAEARIGQNCEVGDTTQICVNGACVTSSCGDGVISGANGEECDTADDVAEGCDSDCAYLCGDEGSACNPGFVCHGQTCDDNHFCGAPLTLPVSGTACENTTGTIMGIGMCDGAGLCCIDEDCCPATGCE